MRKFRAVTLLCRRLLVALSLVWALGLSDRAYAAPEGCSPSVPLLVEKNSGRELLRPIVPLPVLKADTRPMAVRGHKNLSAREETSLRLQILLLSASEDDRLEPSLALARQALESMSIPYRHVALTKNGTRLAAGMPPLEDDSGGLYQGIVLTSGQLAYQSPDGAWHSALEPGEWATMDAYERRYGTRRVALSVFPMPFLGVEPILPGSSEANALIFADPSNPALSGIRTETRLPIEYSWHYPARLTDPTLARAFLYFGNPASDGSARPLAAATSTLPDGREQLSFFFVPSTFSVASIVLSPVWIQWMTRGAYVGARRIRLGIHIDDVFARTELWNMDPLRQSTDGFERHFRLPAEDFLEFTRWQKNIPRRFPATEIRAEMIVNGFDVHHSQMGYGRDALFLAARAHRQEYYWTNHTFTHANLDKYTFEKTRREILANREFLFDLLGEDQELMSSQAFVTPQISGLFNKEALRAFWVSGVRALIGDNTRPELRASNPYDARWSNTVLNGFEGLMILPRQAAQVYFNASRPEELMSEYNGRYRSYWGRDLTLQELMQLEAKRVTNLLLAFRPDPYMFHQANMRSFRWPDKESHEWASLLGLWVEDTLKEIQKYTTLPILSEKFDALVRLYEERRERALCGLEVRMVTSADGRSQRLRLMSERACPVTLTGFAISDSAEVAWESYGPDQTAKLRLAPRQPRELSLRPSVIPQ